MTHTQASEELLAAPLPELIRDLGLAVASANQALANNPGNDLAYTVDEAEIELNIAISIEKRSKGELAAGGNIAAFSVNASYSRTYGFKEEASSRLLLKLSAKPKSDPT
ncbi:MAG: hypothetical protein AAFZ65_15070, partial [Planctomycetota bacterium]